MAAEVIVEVYRTQEHRPSYTFSAAITLSYFGEVVMLQGLSGTFSVNDWRELYSYFQSKGIKRALYFRKGKLKEVEIK